MCVIFLPIAKSYGIYNVSIILKGHILFFFEKKNLTEKVIKFLWFCIRLLKKVTRMKFITELQKQTNISITENEATGYASTMSKLLDLNFAVSSLRNATDDDVRIMFRQAFAEDRELGLKWLFYIRDVRGGLGERRLFRLALLEIVDDIDERVFHWISEFGRYDDMFILFDTHLKTSLINFIKKQISEDLKNMIDNKPVSLLAKWLPSENTSSKETVKLARKVISALGLTPTQYRKQLSKLRKYLDVIEIKMSSKKWQEIKYESVPSRANLIYKEAFYRNDEVRRMEFLEKLNLGETKINAGTLFPHDILHKYLDLDDEDATLENLWQSLPDYVDNEASTIVVCDGSASMTARIKNTTVSCLEIAGALAIYFSERCRGAYKDRFITFSETPQLVDLSRLNTLRKKWLKLRTYDEVANTNIEAVFDLLLKTAIACKIKQKDIPDVLIISDMEFDNGIDFNDKPDKLMDIIIAKWKKAGYKFPKISYWNICSRTMTIPQIDNTTGLRLVSGFSPAVIRQVLNSRLEPFDALKEILLSKRYECVTFDK
jgi:hypothetical protein